MLTVCDSPRFALSIRLGAYLTAGLAEPRHSAAAHEARQRRAEGDFPLTGVAECQCSRNDGFSGPSWRHSPSDLFVLCRIGDETVAIAGGGLR